MDIEEIKSMGVVGETRNLGKALYELLPGYDETVHLVPAMFNDKDILSTETLEDLFANKCVTQVKGGNEIAVGFIGKFVTRAYMRMNIIIIKSDDYLAKEYRQDWYNDIFGNLYGFENGEINGDDTTVYDEYNNWLIDVQFAEPDVIVLSYWYDQLI